MTITRQGHDGEIHLVAVLAQTVPAGEGPARNYLEAQWPELRTAFRNSGPGLDLREAMKPLNQKQVSLLAGMHLSQHQLDLAGDQGVLPKTARMWRLLQQFGSSRPAEVIAGLLGEKVATIHARLNMSRAQGLIPATERTTQSRGRRMTSEERYS